MEIYNEKMERIEAPDMTLGWLEETVRTIHHPAVEAVEAVWHYEIAAEYPNGGRDVRRVIDVPGAEAKDAWDEEIPIRIYHPYTAEELEKRAQEAAQPTMEERMGRMEAAVEVLRDVLNAAVRQWAELPAQRGEE